MIGGCAGRKQPDEQAAESAVASVRLSTTVLLVDSGACRTVVATAYDNAGNVVAGSPTWEAVVPQVATVDGKGRVCAGVDTGSARVRASIGGVQSADLIVTHAAVVEGTVFVEDTSIIEGAEVVTDGAEGASLDEIEVAYVTTAAPPGAGQLVVASEEAAIFGRVLRTEHLEAGTRVVFKVVPPWEVFEEPLNVAIPLDMAGGTPGVLGDGATALYDEAMGEVRVGGSAPARVGLPQFPCTTAGNVSVMELTGTASVTLDNIALVGHFGGPGDWSIGVTGTRSHELDISLATGAELSTPMECSAVLWTPKVPVLGALTYAIGGLEVPISLEVEVTPTITIASGPFVSYTNSSPATPFTASLGVDESGVGLCCDIGAAPSGSSEWRFWEGGTAVEFAAELRVGIGATLQVDFSKVLKLLVPLDGGPFELIDARAAGVVSMSWSPLPSQLDEEFLDGTYESQLVAEIGAGSSLKALGPTLLAETSVGPFDKSSVSVFDVNQSLSTAIVLAAEPTLDITALDIVDVDRDTTIATVGVTVPADGPDPSEFEWWCHNQQAGYDSGTGWAAADFTGTRTSGTVICPFMNLDSVAASWPWFGLPMESDVFSTAVQTLSCSDALVVIGMVPEVDFTVGCVDDDFCRQGDRWFCSGSEGLSYVMFDPVEESLESYYQYGFDIEDGSCDDLGFFAEDCDGKGCKETPDGGARCVL